MHSHVKNAVIERLQLARKAISDENRVLAYAVLEEAHILAQPNGMLHARIHWNMLVAAWHFLDFSEIVGQLGRLAVAAPASWSGRYPRGNVGTTRVSAFVPMPIPSSLTAIFDSASSGANYIPALRFHGLTRFYDKLVAWTCGERLWKARLVALLAAQQAESVLDVGCGTGTLSIALSQAGARVTGIDADGTALRIAQQKQTEADVPVHFQQADARQLPYDSGRFDRAVSSLFFHHLNAEDKARALQEMVRVTTPGGRIVIADWTRPAGWLRSMGFGIVRLLDGADVTQDHANGMFGNYFAKAGLTDPQKVAQFQVPLGTIAIWTMTCPINQARG